MHCGRRLIIEVVRREEERPMPVHLDDLDMNAEVEGLKSALIVPCNMCPAVTVAAKKDKPFIQLFKSFLKSAPFDGHIKDLRARLKEKGVRTELFKSGIPHQWFMCMWSAGRRRKLGERARNHDAVIVLGCESANETVRLAVESIGCKVIEGMELTGFMNAKLRVRWPCNVVFEDTRILPLSSRARAGNLPHAGG
jgi:hypothetical protein